MNGTLLPYFGVGLFLFCTVLQAQEPTEGSPGSGCYGATGGILLSRAEVLGIGSFIVNAVYQQYGDSKNYISGSYKSIVFGTTSRSEAYLSFLSLTRANSTENISIGGFKHSLFSIPCQNPVLITGDMRIYHFAASDTVHRADNGLILLPSIAVTAQLNAHRSLYGVIGYKFNTAGGPSLDLIYAGAGVTFPISESLLALAELSHNDYSYRSSGLKAGAGIKWNMFEHLQCSGGLQMYYERSVLAAGVFLTLSLSTNTFSPMVDDGGPTAPMFIPPPLPEISAKSEQDSDDDGLTDDEERSQYNTDPLAADSDGDSIIDGLEVFRYKTDPLQKDSDRDGVPDGDEILKYFSNALLRDSDGDGADDEQEIFTAHTNPIVADTDSGGVTDGEELRMLSDPLNAKDDPAVYTFPMYKNVVLAAMVNSTIQSQGSLLPKLSEAMKRNGTMSVDVFIYDAMIKQHMIPQRLQSIKQIFSQTSIDLERITLKVIEKQYTNGIGSIAAPAGTATLVGYRRK